MKARVMRGDARALALPDASVDLIVTSPPYFGLRDYGHADQLGAELAPADYIAALIECTREMVRVLKPTGSIFVNLGDKYAQTTERSRNGLGGKLDGGKPIRDAADTVTHARRDNGVRTKSLMLLPERYRIACTDELGLIARAVIVWSKPNGLPESVTDRVRRSHEDWVHLTRSPRYFAAVDEIRESHRGRHGGGRNLATAITGTMSSHKAHTGLDDAEPNPLGKLPGSVWEIATQPLRVPAELAVDHFAAFPPALIRPIILGWSPREVCTVCGEGRRPVVERQSAGEFGPRVTERVGQRKGVGPSGNGLNVQPTYLTGCACACPDTSAPSTPGVVLDPFGGTGTVALVASMHGRHGISVDASWEYTRLAEWRVSDLKERARALAPPARKPLRSALRKGAR